MRHNLDHATVRAAVAAHLAQGGKITQLPAEPAPQRFTAQESEEDGRKGLYRFGTGAKMRVFTLLTG